MVVADPLEPDCRPITGLEEVLEVRLHNDVTGVIGKHQHMLLKAKLSHLSQQYIVLFCIHNL